MFKTEREREREFQKEIMILVLSISVESVAFSTGTSHESAKITRSGWVHLKRRKMLTN